MAGIAACLIVKDGAGTIERSIRSVRAFVDQLCVFDTGSTDATLELLGRLAAEPGPPLRVERGEWRHDFAWARNRAFAMPNEDIDWLLWIDADDELLGGENLPALAERATADLDGWTIAYDCGVYPNGERVWSRREWLVRRGRLVWTAPLHEHLIPVEERQPRLSDIPAGLTYLRHHSAGGNARAKAAILERQQARDVAEHGRPSLWTLFWSGWAFHYSGNPTAAAGFFRDYLRGVENGAPLGPRTLVPMDAESWRATARALLGIPAPTVRPTAGRNDPCPCSSGRKYKRCHGERAAGVGAR